MKTLFTELRQLLEQGEEAVLVTIIASSGSTPRGTGSRMLVRKDGSIEGTVGGGAVEYQAMQTALKAMEDKASFAKGFTLTETRWRISEWCAEEMWWYISSTSVPATRC